MYHVVQTPLWSGVKLTRIWSLTLALTIVALMIVVLVVRPLISPDGCCTGYQTLDSLDDLVGNSGSSLGYFFDEVAHRSSMDCSDSYFPN